MRWLLLRSLLCLQVSARLHARALFDEAQHDQGGTHANLKLPSGICLSGWEYSPTKNTWSCGDSGDMSAGKSKLGKGGIFPELRALSLLDRAQCENQMHG
jgi:hypothetical protein